MTLPELSIKRHVLAFMLSAVLVLFGYISYQRIGMDRFPQIEFPVVSIATTLKGANPDIVDASVTNVIETSINSVPGIEHIQSSSSPGVSVINITFNLDKRVDVAFNEVQAKVNQVLRRLPEDADPPVVAKVETNAMPIIMIPINQGRSSIISGESERWMTFITDRYGSSRIRAASGRSPGSTLPPGNSHSPARDLPCGRLAISTRPSTSIRATATTRTVGRGVSVTNDNRR